MIRQAFWAMEQVPKNEQNKLSRGLRRYFKRSKHLLRKPMEALSSEEQERLLRDAELPELQKSDPFLQRCTEKTAPGLSTPTRSWIIVFFASTPTIDIEPIYFCAQENVDSPFLRLLWVYNKIAAASISVSPPMVNIPIPLPPVSGSTG